MKAGTVADLAEAEQAVRHALDLAERMAEVQLESVMLSVSSGRLGSELFAATVDVAGSTVSDGDIARVLAAGSSHSVRDGRAVLHSLPVGYAVDGTRAIRDPRGMLAGRFGVDMHVVTARHRRGAQSDAGGRALPSIGRSDGGQSRMSPGCRCLPTMRPISAPP